MVVFQGQDSPFRLQEEESILFRVYCQLQVSFKVSGRLFTDIFSRLFGSFQDQDIIGIPDYPMPPVHHELIKGIYVNVCD